MDCNIVDNDKEIYSSDETPIGYYNNKTLYRRFILFGAVSAYTDSVVLDGSSLSGIDIISLTGVGTQSDGSITTLGHYYGSTSNSSLWYNNARIFVRTATAFTKGYVTIIYTR